MLRVEPWLDSCRRRLDFGEFLRIAAAWTAAWFCLFGSLVLIVKLLIPGLWPHALWLSGLTIPLMIFAWKRSQQQAHTLSDGAVLLDRKLKTQGLLLVLAETADHRWSRRLPQDSSLWKNALPRVRPVRFTRIVLLPLLFAAAACFVPLRQAKTQPQRIRGPRIEAVEENAALVEEARKHGLLTPEEAELFKEENRKLEEKVAGGQLTSDVWERIDALRGRIQNRLDDKSRTMTNARQAAELLSRAEKEKNLPLEQKRQLEKDVAKALKVLSVKKLIAAKTNADNHSAGQPPGTKQQTAKTDSNPEAETRQSGKTSTFIAKSKEKPAAKTRIGKKTTDAVQNSKVAAARKKPGIATKTPKTVSLGKSPPQKTHLQKSPPQKTPAAKTTKPAASGRKKANAGTPSSGTAKPVKTESPPAKPSKIKTPSPNTIPKKSGIPNVPPAKQAKSEKKKKQPGSSPRKTPPIPKVDLGKVDLGKIVKKTDSAKKPPPKKEQENNPLPKLPPQLTEQMLKQLEKMAQSGKFELPQDPLLREQLLKHVQKLFRDEEQLLQELQEKYGRRSRGSSKDLSFDSDSTKNRESRTRENSGNGEFLAGGPFNRDRSKSDAKKSKSHFRDVVLPPGSRDLRNSDLTGVVKRTPRVNRQVRPTAPSVNTPNEDYGGQTWKQRYRPRHRPLILKYFQTRRTATSPK